MYYIISIYYIYVILFSVEYALKLMKRAWRDGTAPTRTLDVPDFVERHVHENFAVSMDPKPLPRHRHLEGTRSPLIVRNPPHYVHKSLNMNKSSMGTESGSATSNRIKIKGRRTVKKDNKLQHHPYAHAAKHAKRQSGGLGFGDDTDDDTNDDMSPSPLFTKAGIIGTPEFDAYDKYRLDLFPFKEALKHEINKLVLEKQKLDRINQQLQDERRRQLLEERMRGGSGRRRTRHVNQQQESEEDNETTTEEDDEDDNSGEDSGTITDTTEEDNTEEEEVNEDDDDERQQQHNDVGSCMGSDCLNKYTPL